MAVVAPSPSSPNDTLSQLVAARTLALGDAAFYPQIVSGVLPIIGPSASLDIQRWGADFLAETFASPTFAAEEKQQMASGVLQTLKDFLEISEEQTSVVKSVVQAATSIYPLIFKHIISNPNDASTWQLMAAIKSNILRRMDSASPGVKICCVKFIQRIVQIQTPGIIADPRRPERNELSLALVPRNHPLMPPANLEAEASGLLDRLLSVFQENKSDALLITATLNSLGVLTQTRANIASKIISAVLSFNPFKHVSQPVSPRMKVMLKSMERTVRSFLVYISKRNPNHPLAGRIHGYLEQMQRSWSDVFDENSRKRSAPGDSLDDEQGKRQKLDVDAVDTPPPRISLPAGPISLAQLYTLTDDPGTRAFDAQAVPLDLLNRILVPILSSTDAVLLNDALNAVRSRYLALSQPQTASSYGASIDAAGASAGDNDDEYEPDDLLNEGAEQVANRLSTGFDTFPEAHSDVALGHFKLPPPPVMTGQEVLEYGKGTINRVFSMINDLDDSSSVKAPKAGFHRLAASRYDRDSWFTVVTRLATRTLAGLEPSRTKREHDPGDAMSGNDFAISSAIRDALFMYIISDFRRRIDVAISWLNEEWYNDQILLRAGEEPVQQYEKLALKLLDGMVPYFDAKDKVLIRFLSEIPAISRELLERVKKLAQDPERVSLAVNAIHYLILFRPPVRDICIDAIEDMHNTYDDAKAASAKLLAKWRPQAISA